MNNEYINLLLELNSKSTIEDYKSLISNYSYNYKFDTRINKINVNMFCNKLL